MNNKTIGNEEMMDIFDETTFTRKGTRNKNTKEYQEMIKLYKLDEISIPEEGQVVSAKYVGMSAGQFVFSVVGYKDDVRVDDKVGESKYFKNLNLNDMIDVLITEVNQDAFMIKGSVSSLYESRAHAKLKALVEGESVMVTVKSLNPAGYDVELNHGGVTPVSYTHLTLPTILRV